MTSRRTAKVAQALRHVVSSAVLFGLRDPRVKNVTILHTEVPEDLRTAKVYLSVMGDEKAERLAMHGLNSARGWIQSKIAEELDLRYTPVLTFVIDRGIKKSMETAKLLRELAEKNEAQDVEKDLELDVAQDEGGMMQDENDDAAPE